MSRGGDCVRLPAFETRRAAPGRERGPPAGRHWRMSMRRFIASLAAMALLLGLLASSASAAGADPLVSFDAARADVYSGSLLKAAGGASAADLARSFLKSKGRSDATLASLKVESQFTSRGVTFVRLRQYVGGYRIQGAYVRAATDAKGTLVHVISNIVDSRGSYAGTTKTAGQALDASLRKSHANIADRPGVASRSGKTVYFKQTPAFAARPSAERILVARRSGALERGWLVTT